MHVRAVRSLLLKASVKLNVKKCNFFPEKADYLGHVLQPGKLELTEQITDTV